MDEMTIRNRRGPFNKRLIDGATNSLQIVDYAHHEIHAGSHYFNEGYYDIPAGDVVDIRFRTPDTEKWLHMLISLRSQEEAIYTLYEGILVNTVGAALTAKNSNRNSPNVSGLTYFDYIVNTDIANANLDTDITGATILREAQLGSNQGNNSGENRADNELVLKQNGFYGIRIQNTITSTRYITWLLDWYEHTNKN